VTLGAFGGASTRSRSGSRQPVSGTPHHPSLKRRLGARRSARPSGLRPRWSPAWRFIGWALDRFLGTAPFLMVVFLMLGAAAGILNVVRTAKAMQTEAPPAGKDLPQGVTDDDDD